MVYPIVTLVAVSRPMVGSEPERLSLLAIKVSQGRLHKRTWHHYVEDYPRERVREWLSKALEFPSVLEHVVFTFLIQGVSRVCSHQLVRHRIASYTQESLRYSEGYARDVVEAARRMLVRDVGFEEWFVSNMSDYEVLRVFLELATENEVIKVAEVGFVLPRASDRDRLLAAVSYLRSLMMFYELVGRGVSFEEARYVLPQSIRTDLLMTVNLRELLHIASVRLSPRAHWEIREVVKRMVEEASRHVPIVKELADKVVGEVGGEG